MRILATSDVGISHFRAAVKCTKRCMKNRIKLHMKRSQIVCGWGRAARAPPQTPLGELTTLPSPPSRLGRGGTPVSIPLPSTPFDRCSWTFVGTGRKDGHPQFLKRGCALGTDGNTDRGLRNIIASGAYFIGGGRLKTFLSTSLKKRITAMCRPSYRIRGNAHFISICQVSFDAVRALSYRPPPPPLLLMLLCIGILLIES